MHFLWDFGDSYMTWRLGRGISLSKYIYISIQTYIYIYICTGPFEDDF